MNIRIIQNNYFVRVKVHFYYIAQFQEKMDILQNSRGKGGQKALVGLGGSYLRFWDVDVTGSVQKKMPKMRMMK